MIVDFQHHYVPKEIAQKHGLYSEEPSFAKLDTGVPRLTMHARLYDAEMQLRDMDEAGVDVSVLSCLLGWDATLEDNRAINDSLAELQRLYPGRFVGLAQAPLLGGPEAMAEFDRAVGELGLHGVATTSQFRGLPLDSEQLYPFYETVSALDVPIFVHPAMVPEGYGLLLDYDLARILGREVDLAVAATRIVAGGVLEWFPDLKFVIGHFGGGIAGVKDRLVAKAYRFGTLDKPFEHYFDMLYFRHGRLRRGHRRPGLRPPGHPARPAGVRHRLPTGLHRRQHRHRQGNDRAAGLHRRHPGPAVDRRRQGRHHGRHRGRAARSGYLTAGPQRRASLPAPS